MGEVKLPILDRTATGENIKRLMRLNHITVSQLQMNLGMASATNVYKWCRGEILPSADRLLHLALIFNCHIEDILVTEKERENG